MDIEKRSKIASVCHQQPVGGEQSSRISCKQGVKQRDPLSPILFNFVVDWCSENLDPSNGFRWPEAMCNYLAFADDLVLFAESPQDLQSQLDRLVTALGSCGLTINAAKCSSMVFDVYDRHSFVDSTPFQEKLFQQWIKRNPTNILDCRSPPGGRIKCSSKTKISIGEH